MGKKIGIYLNRNSRVCAHTFNTNDIISTWTSGEGSSMYSVSKQIIKIIIYCICYLEITTLVVSSLNTFYLSFFITYTLKMSISF